jgi:hypothetical protein
VGLPLLAAYALARRAPRPLKRLYHARDQMMGELVAAYGAAKVARDARAEQATERQLG